MLKRVKFNDFCCNIGDDRGRDEAEGGRLQELKSSDVVQHRDRNEINRGGDFACAQAAEGPRCTTVSARESSFAILLSLFLSLSSSSSLSFSRFAGLAGDGNCISRYQFKMNCENEGLPLWTNRFNEFCWELRDASIYIQTLECLASNCTKGDVRICYISF